MSSRRRIAFFRQGTFSHINEHVGAQLREKFPECEVEEIDVLQGIIKPARVCVYRNALETVAVYGWEVAKRSRDFRDCFFRTSYFFSSVRRLIGQRFAHKSREYLFSFQTQSLYDASVDGLDHFVFTDHTHLVNKSYPAFDPSLLFPKKWIDLERSIYTRARLNFVMSHHVEKSLRDDYDCPPERIACIGAGGNLPEPVLPLENNDYRNKAILFVGVDWKRKGGPQLLEAFARVREKIPGARLIIVGCSPPIEAENVEVIGRIPLPSVSDWLRRSSVLALPTRVEPFGVNVIEACLHKIPVVASRLGGVPDMIQDGESGFLVPPDDVFALSEALIQLLNDPDKCRRLGESGYSYAKQNFTWDVVGERLRDHITAALETGANETSLSNSRR